MESIRLSIIIPVYNVEAYIAQCLDSVYRQDIPENEYEVICVDDCSPDNSISIIETYSRNHSNIKIVKNQTNRKLGGARNAGVEVARGNYIMFIDSDDFIADNVLLKLCSTAEEEGLDILHFDYEVFPQKVSLRKVEKTQIMTGPELFFDPRFIWYHDLVTAWRKLYKKSFLVDNNITFAENIMFEDNDYAFLVFAYANKVKHINFFAYNYRWNPDSITHIDVSAQHLSYWMDLNYRLCSIKERFIEDGRDRRFIPVLSQFIRYQASNVITQFKKLSKEEKRIAINDVANLAKKPLRHYISRKNYIRLLIDIIMSGIVIRKNLKRAK